MYPKSINYSLSDQFKIDTFLIIILNAYINNIIPHYPEHLIYLGHEHIARQTLCHFLLSGKREED